MRKVVAALLIALIVASGMIAAPDRSIALAQDAPPELGGVVLENSLDAPGVNNAFNCSSGRGSRQFANGGTTITASGGCNSPDAFPGVGLDPRGLTFGDGEVRVEARHLSGGDRMLTQIFVRLNNDGGFSAYSAQLNLVQGRAEIGVSVKGQYRSLGQCNDIGGMVTPDDWTSYALRAQGQNLWMLINDKVVLSVTDASLESGAAEILVNRTGGPNAGDTTEVSAALRNLKVSALAGGEVARTPSYRDPRQVFTVTNVPCTIPTALPDDINLVAPGPDVDPKLAAWAGAWEGSWGEDSDNPLPARVYIEKIEGSKVTMVTANGNNRTTTASWQRNVYELDADGKIGFGPATRRFSYVMSGDDTVAGTLEAQTFTSKITMHRCPPV